jgi:hypothetical protein
MSKLNKILQPTKSVQLFHKLTWQFTNKHKKENIFALKLFFYKYFCIKKIHTSKKRSPKHKKSSSQVIDGNHSPTTFIPDQQEHSQRECHLTPECIKKVPIQGSSKK